ncbi:hypothetical protein [Mangrovimonas futianensis]|uniref:hypothetical protein n=1 Tax=Mangrovimonas futianensis TaxID=2895523 RepID=UPI001E36221D|nr:hypothetical protein [Mangrovimonas futianensis]MCF1422002.1 hypothetical protein [Mangrovimonas futianensis]
MKSIIYAACFLFSGVLLAQEKPKNVSEETTVKTIKIDNGREVTEKKIKVTTKEEQEIKLDEDDKNKVNQSIVASPKKVTKTVEVDSDHDVFYDSKLQTAQYVCDGTMYDFDRCDTGFKVVAVKNDNDVNFGNAIQSSTKNHYFFRSDKYSGIGYFNSQGNFTVEYFDENKNKLVKQEFVAVKDIQ